MGRTKIFKRLRKQAKYEWESMTERGYNTKTGKGWLVGRTRGTYRMLKRMFRQGEL